MTVRYWQSGKHHRYICDECGLNYMTHEAATQCHPEPSFQDYHPEPSTVEREAKLRPRLTKPRKQYDRTCCICQNDFKSHGTSAKYCSDWCKGQRHQTNGLPEWNDKGQIDQLFIYIGYLGSDHEVDHMLEEEGVDWMDKILMRSVAEEQEIT